MDTFNAAPTFAYLPTLMRLALALALGLFVGLERERRGKEAGLRTFGFAGLLGGLGGLLGEAYALLALGLLGIMVVFLNWATLRDGQGLELTTSAALLPDTALPYARLVRSAWAHRAAPATSSSSSARMCGSSARIG